MAFERGYDYPFGRYAIIKEFNKIDREILERVKKVVKKHLEIKNNLIEFKKNVKTNYVDDLRKATDNFGDVFRNYPWIKKSSDSEDGKGYLINQYKLTAIAEVFVKKMSSVEAAFEASYLIRWFLGSSGLYMAKGPSLRMALAHFWKKKDRLQFKEVVEKNPLIVFLVVKYLEQLGYDKNPVKDEKFCESIEKSLRNLEGRVRQKKLTKEEWDEREEHKVRVQY